MEATWSVGQRVIAKGQEGTVLEVGVGVNADRVRVKVAGGETSVNVDDLDTSWADYAKRWFPPKDDTPLAGRMSRCFQCSKTQPSSFALPFFVHEEAKASDTHYDGCRGWD